MKRYEFKVVIEEGNDEFWEELEGKPACDEMVEIVRDIMYDNFNECAKVTLVKFTDEPTEFEQRYQLQ